MPRYAQSSINEVSRRTSLSDVVSGYVKLKRNGTNYVGLCPFHKEKTGSFHVDEDKQLFYCFGCGAGGNVYDFIMRAENLDFVDALQFLAQRAGVTLEEERGTSKEKREEDSDRRRRILEMNRLAARHFYENLSTSGAEHARAYMERRGLSKRTAIKFGVGFAADGWDDLLNFLKESGYTQEEIVTAGLAVKNEKGRIYDKFRNRLMFPIIDVRGNVIAFGGRALQEGDPAKYMNSPETPVFHKGRNLFALNLAKSVGAKNGLILVEGYMDVIALYQAGIENVVAGLGTALTEEQARLLKRYAAQVYVCYDSDEAGQKAAQKAIGLLTEAGNTVKVISYQGAKDPDEYIQKKGVESFKALLSDSKESLEYQLLRLRQRYDIYDVSQKISFLTEAAKILAEIDSEMTREVYIKRLAAETDISTESIKTEISKLIYYKQKKKTRKEIYAENRTERLDTGFTAAVQQQSIATYKAERLLLNLLFFHRRVYEVMAERVESEWFTGAIHKSLLSKIMAYRAGEEEADASAFLVTLTDEQEKQTAASVLYESFVGEAVQAAKEAAEKLETAFLKKRAGELVREGKVKEANEILQRTKGRRG
ncbi:MAG: DNA primase [Ruminococcaceae bacterium]|nr:DNA primase [Oscillospiraceae bacterium]